MKKVVCLVFIFIMCLTLTSCGNKDKKSDKKEINLENVNEKLDNLTSDEFNIGGFMELNEEEIKQTFNISAEQYSQAVINMPLPGESNICIIIKPNEGEKENIKIAIDKYMQENEETLKQIRDTVGLENESYAEQYEIVKNRYYEEYEGYLIWIATPDNNKVLETIKNK